MFRSVGRMNILALWFHNSHLNECAFCFGEKGQQQKSNSFWALILFEMMVPRRLTLFTVNTELLRLVREGRVRGRLLNSKLLWLHQSTSWFHIVLETDVGGVFCKLQELQRGLWRCSHWCRWRGAAEKEHIHRGGGAGGTNVRSDLVSASHAGFCLSLDCRSTYRVWHRELRQFRNTGHGGRWCMNELKSTSRLCVCWTLCSLPVRQAGCLWGTSGAQGIQR